MINMKKKTAKTANPLAAKFKDAAIQLVANKLFCDFITANDRFAVEPESFYEEWMKKNVFRPDAQLKKWAWRYFLDNLIGYRKFQKLK
jgi:hypothetical protein